MTVVLERCIRQEEDQMAAELVLCAGVQIQHILAGALQAIELVQLLTHILLGRETNVGNRPMCVCVCVCFDGAFFASSY